jgi:hypothetical protein
MLLLVLAATATALPNNGTNGTSPSPSPEPEPISKSTLVRELTCVLLLVVSMVITTILFEAGKEAVTEHITPQLKPILRSLFGELTILGFIVRFIDTPPSGPLEQISEISAPITTLFGVPPPARCAHALATVVLHFLHTPSRALAASLPLRSFNL